MSVRTSSIAAAKEPWRRVGSCCTMGNSSRLTCSVVWWKDVAWQHSSTRWLLLASARNVCCAAFESLSQSLQPTQ